MAVERSQKGRFTPDLIQLLERLAIAMGIAIKSKLTEEELRNSEQRIRSITDAAQDAILMMDARGTISYWNRAAVSILGYTHVEGSGKNLHQLLAAGSLSRSLSRGVPGVRSHGPRQGRRQDARTRGPAKGRPEIAVALSLSRVSLNGEWHALGILRDITERKRTDELQRQYTAALEGQKRTMEELYRAADVANRAKSEFLANMSHEIRTP